MNKDEREGKKTQIKGRVKEATGVITGKKDLETEGANERADGEQQETIGKARRKAGELIEDLGRRIKK
ncbi:MAG TPA: CsbD family protein [Thermoanaerobaculia bacterium]